MLPAPSCTDPGEEARFDHALTKLRQRSDRKIWRNFGLRRHPRARARIRVPLGFYIDLDQTTRVDSRPPFQMVVAPSSTPVAQVDLESHPPMDTVAVPTIVSNGGRDQYIFKKSYLFH